MLRDGSGFLQALLTGKVASSTESPRLGTECSIHVYGRVSRVPEGAKAPQGVEIHVDWYQVIGTAPSGGIDDVLNESANIDTKVENRHLMIRGENTSKTLRIRARVTKAMRDFFDDKHYVEVTPPTLVQTQVWCVHRLANIPFGCLKVEGGSTLFGLNYFGAFAYIHCLNESGLCL